MFMVFREGGRDRASQCCGPATDLLHARYSCHAASLRRLFGGMPLLRVAWRCAPACTCTLKASWMRGSILELNIREIEALASCEIYLPVADVSPAIKLDPTSLNSATFSKPSFW